MKKKIILATLLAMGFLMSVCPSITTAYPMEDLGTFDYRGSMITYIYAPQRVELNYVSSDLYEEAVTVETLQFYNTSINLTQVKFTSNDVPIDWNFKANKTEFIYQDNTSGKLYRIRVDYSQVDVPQNPLLELYIELSEKYNTTHWALENATARVKHFEGKYNETIQSVGNKSGEIKDLETYIDLQDEEIARLQGERDSSQVTATIAIILFVVFIVIFIIYAYIQKHTPIPESQAISELESKKTDANPKQTDDDFKDELEEIPTPEKTEKIDDDSIMEIEEEPTKKTKEDSTEDTPASDSEETKPTSTFENIDTIFKKLDENFEDIDKKLEGIGEDIPNFIQTTGKKIDDKTKEIMKSIAQTEKKILKKIK